MNTPNLANAPKCILRKTGATTDGAVDIRANVEKARKKDRSRLLLGIAVHCATFGGMEEGIQEMRRLLIQEAPGKYTHEEIRSLYFTGVVKRRALEAHPDWTPFKEIPHE